MANDKKPAPDKAPEKEAPPQTQAERMARLRARCRDDNYDEYKNHLSEQFGGKK